MQPDYDLRFGSMAKALSETIIPAIDPSNRSALEQAHILLGSLEIVRQQIDYAHPFLVADIIDGAQLTRRLAAELGGESAQAADMVISAALAAAEAQAAPLSALQAANVELRACLSGLIETAYARGDETQIAAVQTIVLEGSKSQVARERAFVAAAGFDVFPESLVSIADAMRAAA